MPDPNRSEHDPQGAIPPQWWVRPSQGGGEFGPVSPDGLVDWARGARVFPDDQVSPDRKAWTPARDIRFLGMDTIIVPPTGRILGPFHPGAIDALRAAGKVPPSSCVVTGRQILSGETGGEAAEKAAAALREAQARAAALEEELEDVRAEAREALARRDEASGADLASARAAADAARTEIERARAEAEKARAETEKARADLASARVETEKIRAEAAAAKAAAENELAAAKAAAADELAAAKAAAENELAAAKAAAADELEATKAAAADELAAAQSELSDLRDDHTELLAFSDKRDAEAKAELERVAGERDGARAEAERLRAEAAAAAERISSLEEQVESLSANPGARDALEMDLAGDARQVKVLQDKIVDLSRERGELAEKLAAAEASLAVASHPLEGEIAVAKQFADEALAEMRASLEREKKRNDEERSASVARQDALHEGILRLERALRRDPGEKSRSEEAAERNERTIARLKQEMESLREQHKADLGRAAQREKGYEGRISALQQREAALREQLRRVESRTADYDSLGSQLRRREAEIVEGARQFAEAREQWQVVESMLKRRIEELEHGAGNLFENQEAAAAGAAAGPAGRGDAAAGARFALPGWMQRMK